VRPAAASAGPAASGDLRPLTTYRFPARPAAGLPARVTVADSAGRLVASYRLPGDAASHPMLVTVLGADLVLEGRTPAGVLTLRLFDQNGAASADEVAGRWALGAAGGELRARHRSTR
jgi:hypothetical protein